ncbi:alpha-1,4-N-acetylglucosaminyltransferase-like [Neocloeon triangulifer]|uniref:alpha-1,4-N-acetylglucosaminyltransferase-like n=1 Tax=Neocloeon triangulifer TaxID=2078957 RepID=UPI00286FA9D5|nr:alpha-1,4-N-acetylglucosaminyltransferase-like [Neocloeon triangulifer]
MQRLTLITNVVIFGGVISLYYVSIIEMISVELPVSKTLPLFDLTNLAVKRNHDEFRTIFGSRVIVFIETSGSGRLSSRQMCAVESAAKSNPDAQVVLVVTYPVLVISLENNPALRLVLGFYNNINVVTLNATKVLLSSDFKIVMETKFKHSQHPIIFTSDFLRVWLVLTFGGVYFDLDFVIFKDLTALFEKSFVVHTPSAGRISNCAFGFRREHPFLQEIVTTSARDFDPTVYASGPFAFSNAVSRFFGVSADTAVTLGQMEDVCILNQTQLTPIDYTAFKVFFAEGADVDWIGEGYGVHTWNQLSKNRGDPKLAHNSTALYANLARRFCPTAFGSSDPF